MESLASKAVQYYMLYIDTYDINGLKWLKSRDFSHIRHFRENVPYKKVNRKLGHFPFHEINLSHFI